MSVCFRRYKTDVLITYTVLAEAFDDVIQISTGSLTIGWQITHLNARLLRKNILVNVVILLRLSS